MASALLVGLETMLRDFAQRSVEPRTCTVQMRMQMLLAAGFADLPPPGNGHTLQRWRMLAEVAAADLALVKVFEGHTDAQAILHELGASESHKSGLWAVWAAELPQARVTIVSRTHDQVRLRGRKAWCSGAAFVDHAVMTVWDEHEQAQLVALDMNQPGIRVTEDGWQAVGMAESASVEVVFDDACAQCIGDSGVYVSRPGFWQGAAGIAACWYGAGVAIARHVQRLLRPQPHALAHLGALDTALGGMRLALHDCASWIDQHPYDDAEYHARRLRAHIEEGLDAVMRHAGRALGATPFCRDPHFARLMTDLPVFLRQSHAERDLQRLGELVMQREPEGWHL